MADSAGAVGREVAATLGAMSAALNAGRKKALQAIAKDARKTMLGAATAVPGGDRRFSRMGKYNHGGRLNVTTSTRNDLVFVGSKGPWKIAEVGAAPHRVRGGQHPGTRRTQGRASWSRAADPLFEQHAKEVPDTIVEAVEDAFRG